jgi:hypothetical protein
VSAPDLSKTSRMRRAALAGASAFVVLGVVGACQVSLEPNTVTCPPLEDFKPVSTLLEQRCGTLDCHGSEGRPLRIYGQYGLRYVGPDDDPDVLYAGNLSAPTTDLEVQRNYFSVCGIEPEKMSMVTEGEAEPETLTMVRKPRLAEKHKGGRIWDKGKVEDRCLVGWIAGDFEPGAMDTQECDEAVE